MRLGPTVFGRDPFGTARESFAVASPFEDLIADPTLERVYLIECFPYDPVLGDVVLVPFSQTNLPAPNFQPNAIGGGMMRVHYPRVVATAISSQVSIFGNPGALSGGGGTSFGSIGILFASDERDELVDYRWDGRTVRVLLGGPDFGYSQFQEVFRGTIRQPTWDLERFELALRSREGDLQRPVQERSYAGGGGFTGIEGGDDLEGAGKPLAFGAPRNVSPVLVNRGRLVYQFHDGEAEEVEAVFDRAVALTAAPDPSGGAKVGGAPVGDAERIFGANGTVFSWRSAEGPVSVDGASNEFRSNAAGPGPSFEGYVVGQDVTGAGFSNGANNGTHTVTLVDTTSPTQHRLGVSSSLVTESAGAGKTIASDPPLTAGEFLGERARGLLRLGGSSSGAITADVKGEAGGSLGFVQTPADVVRRLVTLSSGVALTTPAKGGRLTDADLDLASFSGLNLVQSAPVSFYTGGEAPSLAEVIDALLSPLLLYRVFTRTGELRVGQASIGSAVDTIEQKDIVSLERIPADLPAWRIAVGYSRSHTVQGPEEVAAGATDSRKDFVAKPLRRVVDEDTSVRTAHPDAVDLEQATALDEKTDAQSEATRQRGLVGVYRDPYRVEVKRRVLARRAAETVTLQHPRFGLSGGRDMLVLSIGEDTSRDTTELVLWG